MDGGVGGLIGVGVGGLTSACLGLNVCCFGLLTVLGGLNVGCIGLVICGLVTAFVPYARIGPMVICGPETACKFEGLADTVAHCKVLNMWQFKSISYITVQ